MGGGGEGMGGTHDSAGRAAGQQVGTGNPMTLQTRRRATLNRAENPPGKAARPGAFVPNPGTADGSYVDVRRISSPLGNARRKGRGRNPGARFTLIGPEDRPDAGGFGGGVSAETYGRKAGTDPKPYDREKSGSRTN